MMEERYQREFLHGTFILSSLNRLKKSRITKAWTKMVTRERNMSTPFANLRPSSPLGEVIVILIPPEAEKKIPTAKIYIHMYKIVI